MKYQARAICFRSRRSPRGHPRKSKPIAAYALNVSFDCERTAPVSHQKRPRQHATNAIESNRKRKKINKPYLYPPAHNGLVAGSSPAGPTKESDAYRFLYFFYAPEIPTHSRTTSSKIDKSSQWHLRQAAVHNGLLAGLASQRSCCYEREAPSDDFGNRALFFKRDLQ
jgi:hypothetical protein